MARFYSNENFPLRAVRHLRALGHDVLTSLEADRANRQIPDEEVLRFATEQGRIILTMNRLDFHRLHLATNGSHDGIVTSTHDPDANALAVRIHQAVGAAEGMTGKLIRIVRSDPREGGGN